MRGIQAVLNQVAGDPTRRWSITVPLHSRERWYQCSHGRKRKETILMEELALRDLDYTIIENSWRRIVFQVNGSGAEIQILLHRLESRFA